MLQGLTEGTTKKPGWTCGSLQGLGDHTVEELGTTQRIPVPLNIPVTLTFQEIPDCCLDCKKR